jgi:hypothetical protein
LGKGIGITSGQRSEVRGSKCGRCMKRKEPNGPSSLYLSFPTNVQKIRHDCNPLTPSSLSFPSSSPLSPPLPSLPTTPWPIRRRAAVADNLKSAGARESRACGQQDSPRSSLALGAESLDSDMVYMDDWSRSFAETGLACVVRRTLPTSDSVRAVIQVPTASIVEVIPATLAASPWEHDFPLFAGRAELRSLNNVRHDGSCRSVFLVWGVRRVSGNGCLAGKWRLCGGRPEGLSD